MKNKIVALFLLLAVSMSLPSCNFQKEENVPSPVSHIPVFGFMSYMDSEKGRLIVCDNPFSDYNVDLTEFRYAIGSDDVIHKIQYIGCEELTGREFLLTFQDSGHIYSVADKNVDTGMYMLLHNDWKTNYILLKKQNDEKVSWPQNIIEVCEKVAGRKIVSGWLMAQCEENVNVGMLEFEGNDDDLLGWLMIERDGEIDYLVCPGADFKDQGYWTHIHTVFKAGNDIIVYLIRYTEESQCVYEIIFQNDGKISESVVCGAANGV